MARGVGKLSDSVDGVHELRDAFQGEEFALDRDEDGIGGDQGVEGQEVEGGRAIDQNVSGSRSRISRAAR